MADNDMNFDLILDAKVRANLQSAKNARKQIEKELEGIEAQIEDISTKKANLDKNSNTYNLNKQHFEKQLQELQNAKAKCNAKLEQLDIKMTGTYESQMSKQTKATERAEQQRLKTVQNTNKQIEQNIKDMYNRIDKMKDSIAKDGDSMTAKQKADMESAISSGYGKIGKWTQQLKNSEEQTAYINVQDFRAARAEMQSIAQVRAQSNAQAKADADELKRKKEEEKIAAQQKAEIEKQAAKEQKIAYQEALSLMREESQLRQKIFELEKKDKLSDGEQQYLNTLKQQLALVQQKKKEQTEIASRNREYGISIANNNEKLERQLSLMRSENAALNETNNKSKNLASTLGNMTKYLLVYQGIGKIQQGMSEAVETIKDLDKAFTDIQLVTQSTNQEIQNLQVSYNKLAKEMSSTTQEVAEGATEWLRQGFTMQETEDLLKSSMTLSKVGAIDAAQSTELLTSALNGFKIEAKDAMSIVDKVSAVDLEAATSSEELMTAMSRTASSAEMAGVSIDKLIGMIATVSSVTRKSASTIGESFKTIFARLQNVKAGKSVDDMGEAVNDVETVLNRLGIKLRESSGRWRDMESVIDEVAEKFNTFTEVEQAQIATAIAGTRQRDNFLALMSNYKTVLDLTTTSEEALGTATEKMAIWQEGLEAKTNELKAAWEGFLISLQQSESLKSLMDAGIWALNNLPTIIGYITALFVAFKGQAILTTVLKSIGNLRLQLKLLSMEATTAGGGFKGFINALAGSITTMGAVTAGIGILIAEFTFLIHLLHLESY